MWEISVYCRASRDMMYRKSAQADFKWYANELLSLNNNYLKFN